MIQKSMDTMGENAENHCNRCNSQGAQFALLSHGFSCISRGTYDLSLTLHPVCHTRTHHCDFHWYVPFVLIECLLQAHLWCRLPVRNDWWEICPVLWHQSTVTPTEWRLVGEHMSYLNTAVAWFRSISNLHSSIMVVPVCRRQFVTSIIGWSEG